MLIEESHRLQDENYELRWEHARIVEAGRTLMQRRPGALVGEHAVGTSGGG